jgi:hypothetical protein
MYKVTAEVIHAFSVPASEQYDESFKVQLMGDNHLKDGQVKKEMLTLSVPKEIYEQLKGQSGKTVTLPVSFFVRGNQLTPFYPKSAGRAAS